MREHRLLYSSKKVPIIFIINKQLFDNVQLFVVLKMYNNILIINIESINSQKCFKNR